MSFVDSVHLHLRATESETNECVTRKFEGVIDKNSDFLIPRRICKDWSKNPLNCQKDFIKFANITLLDVKRSFSSLKHPHARRPHLADKCGNIFNDLIHAAQPSASPMLTHENREHKRCEDVNVVLIGPSTLVSALHRNLHFFAESNCNMFAND